VTYWLGVASREHVKRGVELGIGQIGHGKAGGLRSMSPGDWLVYYSPRERLEDKTPLQAFTAIGEVVDEEIWQADEGNFKPWRRRIAYVADARDAPLKPLLERLELTATPSWGWKLRRGLLTLSAHDFAVIREAMRET
jgi:hypothetical protein